MGSQTARQCRLRLRHPPMYARDLAYIHHHGFGDFAKLAAPGLLRLLRDAGIHRGLVVDLGCGSGIWARALLDNGHDVLGVDPSASMLELARHQAPAASFLQNSAYRAALPPCVAVTALGEVLSYHRRAVRGPSRLPALFRRVAQALPPGGLFVFDLIMAEGNSPMAYRSWRQAVDWAVLFEAAERPRGRWLARDMTTFRRTGQGFRRAAEHHWLRLHRASEVTKALVGAGFRVRLTRHYGAKPLAHRRLGFLARKRKGV